MRPGCIPALCSHLYVFGMFPCEMPVAQHSFFYSFTEKYIFIEKVLYANKYKERLVFHSHLTTFIIESDRGKLKSQISCSFHLHQTSYTVISFCRRMKECEVLAVHSTWTLLWASLRLGHVIKEASPHDSLLSMCVSGIEEWTKQIRAPVLGEFIAQCNYSTLAVQGGFTFQTLGAMKAGVMPLLFNDRSHKPD